MTTFVFLFLRNMKKQAGHKNEIINGNRKDLSLTLAKQIIMNIHFPQYFVLNYNDKGHISTSLNGLDGVDCNTIKTKTSLLPNCGHQIFMHQCLLLGGIIEI